VKQQPLLVVLVSTFGNLLHLSRRGLTSFERRFLEEFEESFHVFGKTAFSSFELLLHCNKLTRVYVIPQLHVSMPHVEKLADLPVLLPPIYLLTSMGTIHGGTALSAVLELDTRHWIPGDATALQTMQLLGMGMIAVGATQDRK
jgi:hypothetical protein